jgi:zinc D-Ala-D-Ala dipeptidase
MQQTTNKIIQRFQMKFIFAIVFFSINIFCTAQDTALNKYGLRVIDDVEILNKITYQDAQKQLVDVKSRIPSVLLDLRYGTSNNFTKQILYPNINATYLTRAAANALNDVQNELLQAGLSLKIFDAYRPYSVTEKMWDFVKDDRYASNPANGSGHNRGVAVDVTITNLQSKEDLNMGTDFDNFTDTAHHNFTELPGIVLENRQLLKGIMEKNGFKALETEWWHYSLPNAKTFELLNIPFENLTAIKVGSRRIKVHIQHGSRPKWKFRKVEKWVFGGVKGGHCMIESDDGITSFHHVGNLRIFPRKENFASEYMRETLSKWAKDTVGERYTSIEMEITEAQFNCLHNLHETYLKNNPYDYAFLGMRCTAGCADVLTKICVLKNTSRFRLITKYFYPQLLRKKLLKMAKKFKLKVTKTKGSARRRWDK